MKHAYALNKAPSLPPYNVFFLFKMTKAAAGGAQLALCVCSLPQPSTFAASFVT